MINKMFSLMAYSLRWLVWVFHYLVIWPAGTVTLIFILIFWLDNSTPGQVAADEIAASTRYINHGEFEIPGNCGPNLGGPLYGERCRYTDAAGYAAFVKNSVDELWRGNLKALWVVMALVYGGLAYFLGLRPYFPPHDNGGTRSAVFRYGTPVSRMSTDDGKKEGEHE
ncbi:conjugal transfer protein TraP [Klebsiella quasipneumoniae]